VIPDNAKLRFITRAPTRDGVTQLRERVKACFEFVMSSLPYVKLYLSHYFSAGALATGCRHHVKLETAYDDLVQNPVLGSGTMEDGELESGG